MGVSYQIELDRYYDKVLWFDEKVSSICTTAFCFDFLSIVRWSIRSVIVHSVDGRPRAILANLEDGEIAMAVPHDVQHGAHAFAVSFPLFVYASIILLKN